MTASETDSRSVNGQQEAVVFQHVNVDELLTLADLAGIKAPGNVMKIVTELVAMKISPTEVHQLVRDVLASRAHQRRVGASAKHSSKRSGISSEQLPESTFSSTSTV